ncbi:phosphoribosylamine--glycine ligase [Trichothermofontia sp.]
MKVLVIGSGGREHAICWKLLQSAVVEQVFCLPGNGGTATLDRCQNVALNSDDFAAIAQFSQAQGIELVIVGPELPLAQGITDHLQAVGLRVFGPTQAGAQIEASKAWAKALMQTAGIPTAQAQVFTDADAAHAYVQAQGVPIVIKADGLAAGKGVTVATTLEMARAAIDEAMSGKFGSAGRSLVIEECLVGEEVSVLALTDGKTIRPLISAQDHKRIGVGDTGPNTGGMGAYAPVPLMTPQLAERVQTEILQPTLQALQQRGIDYRGVLYAGLIITPSGDPKVIEFNCRFGDPEIQAILPLLDTPLDTLCLACAQGTLAGLPPIQWRSGTSACVVMAAGGYPGDYRQGDVITGLDAAAQTGAVIFHAGTRLNTEVDPPTLVTSSGRVLAVTAVGYTFAQAFERVYGAIAQIDFADRYYRSDIGYRVR